MDRSALLKLVGCEERPNRPRREGEGGAQEGRMNSAEYRARASLETECQSVCESNGKGRRKIKVEQRGERGIYGRRESGEAHAGAPYQIGSNNRAEITNYRD